MTYGRLLPARYGDEISSPAKSVTGSELPSARLLVLKVLGDEDVIDPKLTLANMQWGQIITHDMSFQIEGEDDEKTYYI